MKPPYKITPKILELISSISEKIGEINSLHLQKPTTELRKKNRIKTIQASLQIEGNTITEEQITALLNNQRILAPKKDILEVENAITTYNQLETFNPTSFQSFCKAHKLLLQNLVNDAGKLRTKSVGIAKGNKLAHVAPPSSQIKALLNNLFSYLKKDKDLVLIKSCVFHYELEFIHPFMDGNGRMGRLWQTLILMQQYPVFQFLPIETIIKAKQNEYYKALSNSDKTGSSTPFIEFMLGVINASLEELLGSQNKTITTAKRIELSRDEFGTNYFTRKDYLRLYKNISVATASRDLKAAVENNIVLKTGDKRTTKYKFKS